MSQFFGCRSKTNRRCAQAVAACALAALMVLAASGAATAAPPPMYQPVVDLTKDPGCGVEGRSREEKVAHNRRLAEYYFQNYQETQSRGEVRDWASFGCITPGATVLLGTVGAMDPPSLKPPRPRGPIPLTGESLGYFETFTGFPALHGTLAVFPWENGAVFRMMFGGYGRDDGKYYSIWEVVIMTTDDAGRVTHYEMWDDTKGTDIALKKAFGVQGDTRELGLSGYVNMFRSYKPKGVQAPPAK